MTATVHHLAAPGRGPRRYPDHVDLHGVIRQGDAMTHRITYADDAWNLAGAADFDGRSSAFLRFGRIPAGWRDLMKDYVLLISDPGLARTWAPGAARTTTPPVAEPTGRQPERRGSGRAGSCD